MNELICITTFVLLCFASAYASKFGLKHLYVLSVFIIFSSNVTVGIQIDVFGFPVSLGVIIYSIIYLVTDMVSEFYERNEAYKLALTNLIVQIVFYIYIFLSIQVHPSGGEANYNAMESLFSTTARITVAAIVASIGAFLDIAFYEWMMNKAPKSNTGERRFLWVRNILSTWGGQAVNTAIFFTIALYGVVPNLIEIIIGAIVIKWVIAIADTPFIYWAKYLAKK